MLQNELKIAKISNSFNLFPNQSCVSVFLRGCFGRPCKDNCCNDGLHSFIGDYLLDWQEVLLRKLKFSDKLVILGGEPLCSDFIKLQDFCKRVKVLGFSQIGLYTSFDFEEVPESLLTEIEFVKCGFYDITKLNINNEGRLASINQSFHFKNKNWKKEIL